MSIEERARDVVIIPADDACRVTFKIVDSAGTLVDPSSLSLRVMTIDDSTALFSEDYDDLSPDRIQTDGTGIFYINWGDPAAAENIPDQTETNTIRPLLFRWKYILAGETEERMEFQRIEVVSNIVIYAVNEFRKLINKVALQANFDPSSPCHIGFSNGDLITYLYWGLQDINRMPPPGVQWWALDSFPIRTHGAILYKTALINGVTAQELFAAVTDVEGYSDNGQSFVIQKQPKLAAILNRLSQDVTNEVGKFKTGFITRAGSIAMRSPYGIRGGLAGFGTNPVGLYKGVSFYA